MIQEAERLAEAGMTLAQCSTPASCAAELCAIAREFTECDEVGFVGHDALDNVVAGSFPENRTVTTHGGMAGDILAHHEEWVAICLQSSRAGGKLWSGELWLSTGSADTGKIRLTQVLARQASVAFEVVIHRAEAEERTRKQRSLVEAGKALAQELTIDSLLQRVVELACELVDAEYGALGVLDESGDRLARFITTGIDDDTRHKIGSLPTGKGILGVLIHEPHPLRLKNISDHPRSYGFPANHPPMNTFLGVPILSRHAVKGRLYLTEKLGGGEFSSDDEQVAITLASQAAIAIENAELYEQINQANAHKSSFLASMSHELRTPLNSILGYTQLLLDEPGALDNEQQEDVRIIQSSGQHLLGLIGDLLDLSRIEAGRMQLDISEVDLGELVRDVMTSIRPQVEDAKITLNLHAAVPVPIECDVTRVRQMILNVLGNAVKFTPDGTIDVRIEPQGGRVRVSVHDDGPGIPPDDLKRIFESFFQSAAALARTPRAREGAGLGLAITRMLAELHGGSVDIDSEFGTGTTVTIELPCRHEAVVQPLATGEGNA